MMNNDVGVACWLCGAGLVGWEWFWKGRDWKGVVYVRLGGVRVGVGMEWGVGVE